jgi:hypothetical protein
MTTRSRLYTSLIAVALCAGGILPAMADEAVPLPTPKPMVHVAKHTIRHHILRTATVSQGVRVAFTAPIVIGMAF